MVTIPLPTTVGACMPDPVDMSGFFEVGTTEVVFEADANSASGLITCSIMVTVVDNEGPSLTIPTDQVFSLGGGECSSIYNFAIDASDVCPALPIVLTQSVDPVNISNSFACPGGANSYYRSFDLDAMGITTELEVTEIEIGVFQSFNAPSVTVKIHELDGPLGIASLTEVASNTLMLPNMNLVSQYKRFYCCLAGSTCNQGREVGGACP
jgi:hypothetical protein